MGDELPELHVHEGGDGAVGARVGAEGGADEPGLGQVDGLAAAALSPPAEAGREEAVLLILPHTPRGPGIVGTGMRCKRKDILGKGILSLRAVFRRVSASTSCFSPIQQIPE